VALDALRQQITRGADAVQQAAQRIKQDLDETISREQLDRELDRLFTELGIEVYQRIRRGDPVVDSVVVQDLVDRIRQVEERLEKVPEGSTG
jgi:hypothetical protein